MVPVPPHIPADPLPRIVLDVDRRPVRVLPGRRDAAAVRVFSRGQCLALAVALSRATGRPVAAHTVRERGTEVLRHCYAHLDGTGTVLDVSGAHDLRTVRAAAAKQPAEQVRTMGSGAAWAEFAEDLVPQDLVLARSFVPGLLTRSLRPSRGAHAVRR